MSYFDNHHDAMNLNANPILRFDEQTDYKKWKSDVSKKLKELLGIDEIAKNEVSVKIEIIHRIEYTDFEEIRFEFESERTQIIPCYLLIPKKGLSKYPLAICIQGHSTGFHNSIGKPIYEADHEYIKTRGDFGIQAVNNGYAALCIEMRGMGELSTKRNERNPSRGCDFSANTALLHGRTLIGERVWDISKAIDAVKIFNEIDTERIVCAGNSGGGTATFYASCIEQRIKISVPSCAFSSYFDSISSIFHCSCNYIPQAAKYFDMGELACMIAPRKFLVFAGDTDPIFPIGGVKKVFETVEKIYKRESAEGNCRLIINPDGHWWRKDVIWENINKAAKELKWF